MAAVHLLQWRWRRYETRKATPPHIDAIGGDSEPKHAVVDSGPLGIIQAEPTAEVPSEQRRTRRILSARRRALQVATPKPHQRWTRKLSPASEHRPS